MTKSHELTGLASPCDANSTCTDVIEPVVWRTLIAVYLGAILFLSVAFNGTLCLVFYKKPHLLNISNCFVLNLAACHLVMSILVLPFCLYATVSPDTSYSGPWCEIQGFLHTIVIVAVQLALLVISLDRNYAIMNSLRYPNVFTQKLCTIMIGMSWMFGAIISIPPLLRSGLGKYRFHPYQFVCTLDWSEDSAYLIVFNMFSFMMPILIQSFCYMKIFGAAVGHTKRSARVYPWVTSSSVKTLSKETTSDSTDSCESLNSEEVHRGRTQCKAVRTIFLIAVAYCICWLPYLTDAYLTFTRGYFYPNFSAASICLVFSSGIVNPVIYAYMNRVTRREIGRFLCGNPALNDSDDFVSTSMSTYSSAKQNQNAWASQQRMRSRSTGGLNEMDTILEESEDSQICETRSVGNMPICDVASATGYTQTSPKIANKHGDILNVLQLTEDHLVTREIDERKENFTNTSLQPPGAICKGNKSVIKHKPRRLTESAWRIVQTERFLNERRRNSRSGTENYFHREKRRKQRDYGSFLYFEQDETSNTNKKQTTENKTKKRPHRMSVEQKISVSSIPNMLKFRFSVSEIDSEIQKVTVRSNVKIENNAYSPSVDPDQESASETLTSGFDDVFTSNCVNGELTKTSNEDIKVKDMSDQSESNTDSYPAQHSPTRSLTNMTVQTNEGNHYPEHFVDLSGDEMFGFSRRTHIKTRNSV